MTMHQESARGQRPIQDERNSLGKPQLFVQLSWGVSWSDRHIPRTHTVSYTSKHLKDARNSGFFPRQEPAAAHHHRRPDSAPRQHRGERHGHRDPDRPRGRPSQSRPRHPATLSPPRDPRSDSRRAHNERGSERGSSAPPVVHDGLWHDDDDGGPSATLFPRPARTARNAPHVGKALPSNPARFRLGEDGLPWSAAAWPYDLDGDDGDEPPFANHPTTLPLSPPNRRHSEDPQRVKDLESLSSAMVTVDNGFENQWWNQGEREAISWLPPVSVDDDERPMSMADAVLLAAAEPPSGVETYSPISESLREQSLRDLVSPLSDASPNFSTIHPLHRSHSTRSDELWMGN